MIALLGLTANAGTPPPDRVKIQLLGVNDFHGHLEPPKRGVGGAAWLAAHLDRAAAAQPGHTIRVHAGDMVGASPLISSHWKDEPTVEAMNGMDFDVGTLGNHEFDEGAPEALRLVGLAKFPYIAANSIGRSGQPLLPPYRIVNRGGVRVGFIGVTTESTPTFLLARHSAGLRFLDISDTVNRYVPELQARGVEAIVVLAHSGALARGGDSGEASGEIVDEARQMDGAVDVIVAGHTHSPLNVRVPNRDGAGDKLIAEARSYGVAYDAIRLEVDRQTGEVVSKAARLPATRHRGIEPDVETAALVGRYAERVAPLGGRVLGRAPRAIEKEELAPLVARAQRQAAGADMSLLHMGNLRDGIEAGRVTYSDLFKVHAYEHPVLRLRMRGSDLAAQLEAADKLYVSGSRTIDPQRTYTVAVNELIATGRHFPILRDRALSSRVVGTDLEALVRYVERLKGPVTS